MCIEITFATQLRLLWPLEDSQLRQVETNATGNAVQPMCGFARRGDGWLTLFRVSKAKESPSFMHSICITIFSRFSRN